MSERVEKGVQEPISKSFTLFLTALFFRNLSLGVLPMISDEEVDEEMDVMLRLQKLSFDLKTLSSRAQKLLSKERHEQHLAQQNNALDALSRVEQAVSEANAALHEIEQKATNKNEKNAKRAASPLASTVKMARRRKKKSSSVRKKKARDEDEDEDEHAKEVRPKRSSRSKRRALEPKQVERKAAVAPIRDGMAGRFGGDGDGGKLAFFSLQGERGKGRNQWEVTVMLEDGDEFALALIETVKRSELVSVSFTDLSVEEKAWYLVQLEQDVLKRFGAGFPVLFGNDGVALMEARGKLLRDDPDSEGVLQGMVQHAERINMANKVSPSLSAVNNTAVMWAAVVAWHRQGSASDRS